MSIFPQGQSKVVIKIGSKCIFSNGHPDTSFARRLGKELQHALFDCVLFSSGAGAFGKHKRNDTRKTSDIPLHQVQAYTAIGQPELMQYWRRAIRQDVGQLLVTYEHIWDKWARTLGTIDEWNKNKILPILNWNDPTDSNEVRMDNDLPSATLAIKWKAAFYVGYSETSGLLDAQGNLIPYLPFVTPDMTDFIKGTNDAGTGGAASKFDAVNQLTHHHIPGIICDKMQTLQSILHGTATGTYFGKLPEGHPLHLKSKDLSFRYETIANLFAHKHITSDASSCRLQ